LRYRATSKKGWNVPCYAGWYHARILTDGTIQPCGFCNVPCGSLKEKSFIEIWNDKPYGKFRRKALEMDLSRLATESCYCEHCCYAEDNLRVHRVFKHALPFVDRMGWCVSGKGA
jgi:MoaA/NifB/PqqE/SkfB family radical SAM enzyme